MITTLEEGIIIGGAGGAIAGFTILLIQWLREIISIEYNKKKIYKWLKERSIMEPEKKFRKTRTIASWTNLTEDRVRYICSIHKNIYLSVGVNEDLWSVFDREQTSVYEDRGVKFIG